MIENMRNIKVLKRKVAIIEKIIKKMNSTTQKGEMNDLYQPLDFAIDEAEKELRKIRNA